MVTFIQSQSAEFTPQSGRRASGTGGRCREEGSEQRMVGDETTPNAYGRKTNVPYAIPYFLLGNFNTIHPSKRLEVEMVIQGVVIATKYRLS